MGAEPDEAPRPRADALAGEDSESTMGEALAAFRDRARVTNLARVQVIADDLKGMRAGVLSEQMQVTAHAAAHSLAGSAGTFGFEQASQLGRSLEALLEAAESTHDSKGTEDLTVSAGNGLEQVALLRRAWAEPGVSHIVTGSETGREGEAQ